VSLAEFPIANLIEDERFWPRVQRSEDRVTYLADVLSAGGILPAVKIQRGTAVVLGGWHTIAAYRRLHRDTVPVETVDIPPADQLLFAYHEDAAAALPYSAADVKSVARRLYRQRSNGQGANVVDIARDLGRARQTVEEWLADLVAADNERERLHRFGRAVAAHALSAARISQRRVGKLLGVSQKTVSNDAGLGITTHFADQSVVDMARGFIAETATRGSTPEERRRASDWLLEQVDPSALHYARQVRALNAALDWTRSAREQLDRIVTTDLVGTASSTSEDIGERRRALLTELEHIRRRTQIIEGSTV
jgi:hypothetical protein